MTFEFLIACRMMPETDIVMVLAELLARALEDSQNELDEGDVADLIQLRYQRAGTQSSDDSGEASRHVLIDFVIELPNETELKAEVIEAFAKSLPETPPIFHVVKFEDPLLRAELTERASEIFSLEMKLRRVLSLIYLQAYQGEDPFNLLRDEVEQPTGRDKPTPDQMRAANENQFFHLTFGQYTNLNQPPPFKQTDVLELIRDSESYEALRAKVFRLSVENERDADFLANLKSLMNSIDGMRNCVAHNRRPTKRIAENYPNARVQLEERLDEYLAGLTQPSKVYNSPS